MERSRPAKTKPADPPQGSVSRSAWQKALMGPCKGLTREQRLTMLACSQYMSSNGKLSRPEADLTKAAEIDWRALARHRKAAVQAGWLIQTENGRHGTTATYFAAVPVAADTQQGVSQDTQLQDEACHPTGRYGHLQPVPSDTPSFKTSRENPAAMAERYIFPVASSRGRLSGGLTMDNPKTGTRGRHASTAASPHPVLADLRFVLSPAGNWGAA